MMTKNATPPRPQAFPAVCIPSGTLVHADFMTSLVNMLMDYVTNPMEKYDNCGFRLHNRKGSILSQSRQGLVNASLKDGCSHVLFIDSDMKFPAQTLRFLIDHDVDVVAANCATKAVPPKPTARLKDGTVPGIPVSSGVASMGLESVWRVGTGIMLVKIEVFKKLPLPWFEIRWNPEVNDYTGEDWRFCELCEEYGIDRYIDHDFSKFVYHLGSFAFGQEHIPNESRIQVPSGLRIVQ